MGASEAQAQTCELDVPRGAQRAVPARVYNRDTSLASRNVVNIGFTVSSGCASVISTGPLRIAYYMPSQSPGGTANSMVSPDAIFGTQPAASGRGTFAAAGRSARASVWEFTAAEVAARRRQRHPQHPHHAGRHRRKCRLPLRPGAGKPQCRRPGLDRHRQRHRQRKRQHPHCHRQSAQRCLFLRRVGPGPRPGKPAPA